MLLVMGDGGYLAPPSQDPSKEKIWTETRKRLDRFLPNLFVEIFPESSNHAPQHAPSSTREVDQDGSPSTKEKHRTTADALESHQNGEILQSQDPDGTSRSEVASSSQTEKRPATNASGAETSPDDVD
jgi:golgi-specific brefeldin A-resistance guanine nucleotide exchange factor 1